MAGLAIALGVLFLFAAGVAVYARNQKAAAEDARKVAEEQRQEAEKQSQLARDETIRADEQKREAEKQRQIAEAGLEKITKLSKNLEVALELLKTQRKDLQSALRDKNHATDDLIVVNENLTKASEEAKLNERISTSRELAAASMASSDKDKNPLPSIYLSLYSVSTFFDSNKNKIKITSEGLDSLQHSLSGSLMKIEPLDHSDPDTAKGSVTAMGFGSDEQTIFTLTEEGKVRKWDTAKCNGKPENGKIRDDCKGEIIAEAPADQTTTGAISSNGLLLALGKRGKNKSDSDNDKQKKIGQIVLESLPANGAEKILATIQGHKRGIYTLKLSDDGKYLATANNFGNFALFDVACLKEIRELWDKPSLIDKIQVRIFANDIFRNASVFAFSHDKVKDRSCDGNNKDKTKDKTVAVGFSDGKTVLYDAKTGAEYTPLPTPENEGHSGAILSMAFSPTRSILVTSGVDRKTKVWNITDIKTKKTTKDNKSTLPPPKELRGSNLVTSMAFSSDGRFLATGSEDRTVTIWDADDDDPEKYTPLVTLPPHEAYVNNVVFSPDGKLLATVSSDKTTKIWDISSIQMISELHKEIDALRSETKFTNGVADVPELKLKKIIQGVKGLLYRRLSSGECQVYLRGHCPPLP